MTYYKTVSEVGERGEGGDEQVEVEYSSSEGFNLLQCHEGY